MITCDEPHSCLKSKTKASPSPPSTPPAISCPSLQIVRCGWKELTINLMKISLEGEQLHYHPFEWLLVNSLWITVEGTIFASRSLHQYGRNVDIIVTLKESFLDTLKKAFDIFCYEHFGESWRLKMWWSISGQELSFVACV